MSGKTRAKIQIVTLELDDDVKLIRPTKAVLRIWSQRRDENKPTKTQSKKKAALKASVKDEKAIEEQKQVKVEQLRKTQQLINHSGCDDLEVGSSEDFFLLHSKQAKVSKHKLSDLDKAILERAYSDDLAERNADTLQQRAALFEFHRRNFRKWFFQTRYHELHLSLCPIH